ncbi:MAG: hypothetical protein KR126chlam6_00948 [Candidatus Anoxychlamydiales bacterium]|nr:hypothetical protein [Candidatus Anoxychlamydiales bacterium]
MFDNAVQFKADFIVFEKDNFDALLHSKGSVYNLPMDKQRFFNFILSKPIQTSKGFFRIIFGADLTYDNQGNSVVDKYSCRIVPIKLNSPKEFQKDFFNKWYELSDYAEYKIHEIFMIHLHVEA